LKLGGVVVLACAASTLVDRQSATAASGSERNGDIGLTLLIGGYVGALTLLRGSIVI
jgi:hypothetical protein